MNEEAMNAEVISKELVAPTANVLDVQERASIDMQIATAKQYPRSITAFKERAVTYATLDEETAESCIYRRPVGKKDGKQTYAEGLSIRTAEIVGSCYGNLRVGARIVEQTPRYVKAQGVAHDLETNFYATSEVIESTVYKDGKPYEERMRIVIAKAALAKARRDATFQVVPRALAKPIESAVRDLLYGNAQSLTKRRTAAEGWIKKLGIDEERVYVALGIGGIDDMTAKELELLTGIRTAIKNGDTTIDEAFPEIGKKHRGTDKFAAATKAAEQTPDAPAPTETRAEVTEPGNGDALFGDK